MGRVSGAWGEEHVGKSGNFMVRAESRGQICILEIKIFISPCSSWHWWCPAPSPASQALIFLASHHIPISRGWLSRPRAGPVALSGQGVRGPPWVGPWVGLWLARLARLAHAGQLTSRRKLQPQTL